MLEIEKYVTLALNEIRGEIKRDDAIVNAFCSIVALMSYKSYIESLYLNNQPDLYYSWIGKALDDHPYLNEIKRCINETLEEKKINLLNLSSYNVYSFNDENEHVNFIKRNTNFRHWNGIHQIYSNTGKSSLSNFGVLFVKTEEIESDDTNDSEIEYFNSYLIVNFVLNKLGAPKYFNYGGTFLETNFEKTNNVHKLLGKIDLNFNSRLTQNSGKRTFSDILRDYIKITSSEQLGLNYKKIKSYIEKTVSDDVTNKFLGELRRIFNHELTHWKQKLGTFKRKIISSDNTNKRFRKVNVLRNNWGLPEVPARKKERDRLNQGDLYDKVFRDGSMTRSQAQNVKASRFRDPTDDHNVDHELRPEEFYPRLGDALVRLKKDNKIIKLLNRGFIIDKEREKIKVSVYWDPEYSSMNSNEAINTFFKIFIQNDHWFSYLKKIKQESIFRSSLEPTVKRAKRYYKKAISELYSEYTNYINNHKRTMISLYKKNKTKILKDIENFKIRGQGIYINNNYLKEIDNVTVENIEENLFSIHRELYSIPIKDQEIDEVFSKINFDILNRDHIKIAVRKFNPVNWSGEVENFWLDVFDEFEAIIENGDLSELEELKNILEFIYINYYDTKLGDLAAVLGKNPAFSAFY